MTDHLDKLGQEIKVRDLVVSDGYGERDILMVTKLNPVMIRLSKTTQKSAGQCTIITKRYIELFGQAAYDAILDKNADWIVDVRSEAKQKPNKYVIVVTGASTSVADDWQAFIAPASEYRDTTQDEMVKLLSQVAAPHRHEFMIIKERVCQVSGKVTNNRSGSKLNGRGTLSRGTYLGNTPTEQLSKKVVIDLLGQLPTDPQRLFEGGVFALEKFLIDIKCNPGKIGDYVLEAKLNKKVN